jgi:hypothetical protein
MATDMIQARRHSVCHAMLALGVCSAVAGAVTAQDVVTTVVPNANAVAGSAALATFGFDPTGPNGGTIYAAGFGAGAEIRRIANVDGSQSVTQMVAQSAWTMFLKNGDPTNGGGQPLPNGLLLNPMAIGSAAPFTLAVVSDGASATTVSGSRRNDLTQKIYTYSLGTGTAAFASLVTQAEMAVAAGLTNPVTSATGINISRQFAYSGDGQAVYIADSTAATAYGGIYRADLATGTVSRLLADTDCNTEVAVLTSGATDTILLRGGGSTGNTGGIDRITFNRTTGAATARTSHLPAATLAAFLETTPTDIVIASMASGTDGSVYFNNTDSTPERRGIFKLDSSGRLVKVVSHAERAATFGGSPNSSTLRMQPRSTTHPNGFTVTQLLYAESSPLSMIAGAYDFTTGDFDRDNDVDAADLALFQAAVGARGAGAAAAGSYKFDLNGNNAVDWKDVKILQTFLPTLLDGDANMDLALDLADLDIIRDNYYTATSGSTGKSWTTGDFASLDPLATTYAADAADATVVNLVDLQVFATSWLQQLGQPLPTTLDLDARGYGGQFRQDVLTAFALVPEPTPLVAALAAGAAIVPLLRHRRRQPPAGILTMPHDAPTSRNVS